MWYYWRIHWNIKVLIGGALIQLQGWRSILFVLLVLLLLMLTTKFFFCCLFCTNLTSYCAGENSLRYVVNDCWVKREIGVSLYVLVSVCRCSPQSDGVIVGFISVTSDVDLKRLHDFELSEFDGLYRRIKHDEPAAQSDSREEEEGKIQTSDSQQVTELHFCKGARSHYR